VGYQDRHDAARRLDARLRERHDGWGTVPLFAEHEQLLTQLVSRIVLAQNGREVRLLASELDERSLRVSVFLDDAVIDASFKEGALVVDVLPLEIAALRITSTQDVLSDDPRVDPDSPLAVNVTLREGRTLVLRGSGAEEDDLTAYLPTLVAKTAASS
jgi:hypothetical protein